jgi:hypothetical protein
MKGEGQMKTVRFWLVGAALAVAALVPVAASAFQPGGCPGMGC